MCKFGMHIPLEETLASLPNKLKDYAKYQLNWREDKDVPNGFEVVVTHALDMIKKIGVTPSWVQLYDDCSFSAVYEFGQNRYIFSTSDEDRTFCSIVNGGALVTASLDEPFPQSLLNSVLNIHADIHECPRYDTRMNSCAYTGSTCACRDIFVNQ